jgi:2'-5' RNA ligase
MNEAKTSRRLFFALWPDVEIQQALHDIAREIHDHSGGKPVARDKIHMTLLFLGELTDAQHDCITAAAGRVRSEPFEFRLDGVAFRKRQHMAWAVTADMPEALPALVNNLKHELEICDVPLESRPFHAHVTLLRKLRHMKHNTPLEPLAWAAHEFCLVESTLNPEGSEYRIVARWPLG